MRQGDYAISSHEWDAFFSALPSQNADVIAPALLPVLWNCGQFTVIRETAACDPSALPENVAAQLRIPRAYHRIIPAKRFIRDNNLKETHETQFVPLETLFAECTAENKDCLFIDSNGKQTTLSHEIIQALYDTHLGYTGGVSMAEAVPCFEAHLSSFASEERLKHASSCGCFYCRTMLEPQDICDWVTEQNGQRTPLCPHCGMDSVASACAEDDFVITPALLDEMYLRFFDSAFSEGKDDSLRLKYIKAMRQQGMSRLYKKNQSLDYAFTMCSFGNSDGLVLRLRNELLRKTNGYACCRPSGDELMLFSVQPEGSPMDATLFADYSRGLVHLQYTRMNFEEHGVMLNAGIFPIPLHRMIELALEHGFSITCFPSDVLASVRLMPEHIQTLGRLLEEDRIAFLSRVLRTRPHSSDDLKDVLHIGCFHCGKTYYKEKITDWTNDEDGVTQAVCPECGKHGVVFSSDEDDYIVDNTLLSVLHDHLFPDQQA